MNASSAIAADDLVLGVDGGGTKTVAWLARRSDDRNAPPLGVGQAGPGNPRAAGFDTAQRSIAAAVAAAFADAGLAQRPVRAACLGLSGAGRSDEQARIRDWAMAAGMASAVEATHDAEIILAGATAADDGGAVLICGTGSFAWGRNAAGAAARSGGWGYLLGDEGSGYAIALAGLRAAVKAADGRGPETALLPALLARLGAASPPELIGRLYAPTMTRERIAELAPLVFESADADPVSQGIISAAGEELAEMIAALVHRLALPRDHYPLALAGSVVLQQPRLRLAIEDELRRLRASPGAVVAIAEPVRGAVELARRSPQLALD